MIVISKTVNLTGGSIPYSYSWTGNNPCISFDVQSGITTGAITVNISFEDEACLDSSSITLTATDKNGCFTTVDVPVTNPCDTFSLSDINLEIELGSGGETRFIYTVTPLGGNPGYTYVWTYSTTKFILAPDNVPNSDTLILELIPGQSSQGISVVTSVTITDSVGCIRSKNYSYTFCQPQGTVSVVQDCLQTGVFSISQHLITVNLCNGIPVNWNTLAFNTPNGVTASVQSTSGNTALINLQIDPINLDNLDFIVYWTVTDGQGIVSTQGSIQVYLVSCGGGNSIVILPYVHTFPCDPVPPPSIFFILDLDDPANPYIQSSCPIDWTTFTFIPQAGQTLVTPILLTTPYGVASLNINHELVYEWSTPGDGPDVIAWQVCNTCSPVQCTNTAYNIFIMDCIDAPVAVDDDACTTCGGTIDIDVLANDTGTIDPTTIMITVPPVNGLIVNISNLGIITYMANADFSGTDTFTYTVSGYDPGSVSNPAVVTIEVICAGNSSSAIECN